MIDDEIFGTNMNDSSLKEKIDNDVELRKIGTRLIVVSLIFMSMISTGAKLQEANTFIFKITFDNQDAIPWLFLVVISYLFFRYYTYARVYHYELERKWIERLERSKVLIEIDHENNELFGLVVDLEPKRVDLNYLYHSGIDKDFQWNFQYSVDLVFVRTIRYYGGHVQASVDEEYEVNLYKSIGLRKYLSILLLECRYQVSSFIRDKERLDLIGPYIISIIPVLFYFYGLYH